VRVHLLGVRGSTPCPGHEFEHVGGHTSCVAIAHDGGAASLILDAGTGLRSLPDLLDGAPFAGSILLGHLHWDHTQGLPFSRSVDHHEARVHLALPAQGGSALGSLSRGMSPPHFPIAPDELRGDWSFANLDEGWHEFEGFRVLAAEIPHKGGRTFGYRVEDGDAAVAYLSDHAPQNLGPGPHGWGEYHDAACRLADGVDVLIHDAQYTFDELATRGSFGHAAADYSAGLAEHVGARRVLLFHHDPARTDPEVEAVAAAVAAAHPSVVVDIARQGMVVDL